MKVKKRVGLKKETFYNLHIHNDEENKLLHVSTDKRKFNNFVKASTFFLSESQEMKSCEKRVETANAGTVVVLASSAYTSA